MKIRLVGAEFFDADRQTHMTKLIVGFCNFGIVPKSFTCLLCQNFVSETSCRSQCFSSVSDVALHRNNNNIAYCYLSVLSIVYSANDVNTVIYFVPELHL
jgi:hypothetical protein